MFKPTLLERVISHFKPQPILWFLLYKWICLNQQYLPIVWVLLQLLQKRWNEKGWAQLNICMYVFIPEMWLSLSSSDYRPYIYVHHIQTATPERRRKSLKRRYTATPYQTFITLDYRSREAIYRGRGTLGTFRKLQGHSGTTRERERAIYIERDRDRERDRERVSEREGEWER